MKVIYERIEGKSEFGLCEKCCFDIPGGCLMPDDFLCEEDGKSYYWIKRTITDNIDNIEELACTIGIRKWIELNQNHLYRKDTPFITTEKTWKKERLEKLKKVIINKLASNIRPVELLNEYTKLKNDL